MAKTFKSDLSGNEFPLSQQVSGKTLRKSVLDLIQKDYPQFTADNFLADKELSVYREKYISNLLVKEMGELTDLEETVIKALKDKTIISESDDEEQQAFTFGQRVADKVAEFGGSWKFIIAFGVFILIWITLNVLWLVNKSFDPYPFILLNLILSCIAALQAPVIMMSQNRQEEKDRERSKKDYMVNLKSELEIRVLHEKIDHLIVHQQQELLEIQKIQIEMMNDILKRFSK